MNRTAAPPGDHELLVAAVREAGALALRYFVGSVKSWEKAPGDPVSEADLAVDALLREHLMGPRPGYGWLSEESEDDGSRRGDAPVWIVDPIDGTRAFLRKRPEFSVSVALVMGGRPVAAAVFNPATDELFEAEVDRGARLNGDPTRVSAQENVAGATLIANRRVFLWSPGAAAAEFQFVNSMAYRMALVAAGRADATLSMSAKSDWDVAAADLIVREAGGLVTTANGAALAFDNDHVTHASILAAGPALHTEIIAGLAEARTEGASS